MYKNQLRSSLLALALLAWSSSMMAQKPNYSGTWVLNFDKSKLEHRAKGLTGSVFVIRQEGDTFELSRAHLFGEKQKKISFKMLADGQTRRIKLLFRGKLEWQGDKLVATLWRKNFLNVVNYQFGGSKQEFVADEVFKGRPQDHHNVWVFDRQASPSDE